MTPRAKQIASGALGAAIGIAATLIAWGVGTHGKPAATTAPAAEADEPKGTATVSTVPLRAGQVSDTITAYGSVTAEPGAVAVLSVPVECRVRHLRVSGGQAVDAGAAVVEIEPSPDAKLQLLDARNALESARKDVANARQRFGLKLATTGEVQVAEAAQRSAQAKVDDLTARGAGADSRVITAGDAGVVARVDVQEGQLVPAGGPLVEVVPRGQIEVRLGVEPDDAASVRANQPVQLSPTSAGDDDEPIGGTVRLVTRRVNPDSRLVDVFVAPAESDPLLLDQFVRGELTTRTVSGLVVPHDALLSGDDGFSIFTVVDGKAVRHAVKVAVQTDKQAAITGDGLREGDAVVVAGALELDDGVAVTVTAPTTAPAEDEK
jgi:RND family efflux transporter MFP subunit